VSIDIDQFDECSPEELDGLSNAEHILQFLYQNRDKAWKAKEIAKQTSVNENSIHPVLARLEDRELVRHKGAYWAITQDLNRLRQAYNVHRANRLFNNRYGDEDRDEWVDASESH